MAKTRSISALVLVFLLIIFLFLPGAVFCDAPGKWLAGDFHHHSHMQDGSHSQAEIARRALGPYGLDWLVNSEHGGRSRRRPQGEPFPSPVWRWLTLAFYSYPDILDLRRAYPQKLLLQGLEWNVPGHDHASVAIVPHEPVPLSNFEYRFDAQDRDDSRAGEGLRKENASHVDALAAARWLQQHYPTQSYLILHHPSRKLAYTPADLRDFNDAAPQVAFGFEGLPGHQKAAARGGYDKQSSENGRQARTYGGVDYMLAKVGGLWDALLGEGRRFWVFANSDFHDESNDFWPGEYAKNYTFLEDHSLPGLVAGLRSGRSFAVLGDLIDGLDFRAADTGGQTAHMGQTLTVKRGAAVNLLIRFRSPPRNHNNDPVQVDHLDLIAGAVTKRAAPGTDDYGKDTNDTTRIMARFTRADWRTREGWQEIRYKMSGVDQDRYFRLRGTNLGLGVENETDGEGNPLLDDLMGVNNATKAYRDLWFYSNPIFIKVRD